MLVNFLIFLFSFFTTQDELQAGINYFNSRAENSKGLQANTINIDKAIKIFDDLLKQHKDLEVAGGYYMQSLNYKGRFVCISESEKRRAFTKAIQLGNELVLKFPKNGKIRFEYISAISLLAEIKGLFSSIDDDVVSKLLYHTKILIQTDSMYNEGGGWKVFAVLNYKIPYIPFVITWPDKDEAVAVMKNALKHFPTNVGCNFYYAEALFENDQKKLAKIYFEQTIKLLSRKDFIIEDEFFKVKAKKYLESL